MESNRSVIASVRPGEWMTSIDFKDAYFHIPIHESCRHLLRFATNGRVFEYVALPFGLATAPRVFTRVASAPVATLHCRGLPLNPYLDDWLLHNLERLLLGLSTQEAVRMLTSLGWIISIEKSILIPTQDMVFIGMRLLTREGIVCPPLERIDKMILAVTLVLTQRTLAAKTLLSLLGLMNSFIDINPWARLRMRPVQLYLLAHWRPFSQSVDNCIPVLPPLRAHLQWWLNREALSEGRPLTTATPSLSLFTDASKEGWGAHIENRFVAGTWDSLTSQKHINWLELEAVFLALQQFEALATNQCVLVNTDNTTVVAYINKMGGPSVPICAISCGI